MKNPVAGLATAAPRALDSLLGASADSNDKTNQKKKKMSGKERTCSFDLDLSGLRLDDGPPPLGGGDGSVAGSAMGCGGSIAEGSVATFEELAAGDFSLDLDWDAVGGAGGTPGAGTPSPN